MYDAIKTMAERSIGAVVVVEGDTVLGMMSERDYARKVVLQDRSSRSTKVRDIMTDSVYYVGPGDTRGALYGYDDRAALSPSSGHRQ